MPSWKKVLVSGSDANLNSLQVTNFITANQLSGSFSGSFEGDGSGLTNLTLPNGLISSSTQVDYFQISNIPSGILSSSTQIASEISGAFTSTSSSIAFDITGLDSRLDFIEGKTLVSGSSQIILQDTTGNLSGSRIVGDVPSSVSSSHALFSNDSDLLDGRDSSVFATTGSNTFTGTQTFDNIVVTGTGSFGYIESVTGSAKIIGDAFIILNNNPPAEPYGGIKVVDSGSTGITASLLWDGTNNHWVYENISGSTYGASGFMSGPRSTGLNNILYPTQYRVLRSQGGDHIYDSNITDNDSLVSVSIPLYVTGDITSSANIKAIGNFVGNLIGNADTATTASYANFVEYSNIGNKPTLLSSSAQIASEISGAFNDVSSSLATRVTSLENFSSSLDSIYATDADLTAVSSSLSSSIAGVDTRLFTLEGKTLVSSSSQIIYNQISSIPAGIVSSSSQVSYTGLSNIPVGIVSSSAQIDVTQTQKYTTLATTGSNTFTDNQIISGSLTVREQSLYNTGSITVPSISVFNDTNTGIYFPASDTIGFVEGGTEVARINSSGDLILSGSLVVSGSLLMQRGHEKIVTSATAATGTINYDALTQSVLYYTSNATGNWTLNIRGNASTTLNNTMEIGRALTVVFMVTNGATPYRQTGFQIDGSSVVPKWQGGSAPAAGNANSVDSYTVVVIKTANATFSVFESQTRFA